MKRIILIIAVLGVAMISCQEDNSVNALLLDQLVKPVTITGRLKVYQQDNIPIPAGLTIIAEISTSSFVLNPGNAFTYATKYYQTTTTATGEYTLNVEAGPNGSEVTLYQPAFRATVIENGVSTSKLLNGRKETLRVQKGRNEIFDLTYYVQ